MSLIVNALLLDPQGQPLANLDAQVYLFALAGTAKLVGAGRSGADGRISLNCTFTPVATADYQPRIQLRLKRGTTFVEASENPQSSNGSVCDFGTVSFNPAAVVLERAQFTAQVMSASAVANTATAASTGATSATSATLPAADVLVLRDQITVLTQSKTTLELQVSQITAQKNTALADVQARDTLLAQKDALLTQRTTDLSNLQAIHTADLKARDTLLAQKDAAITQKTTDLANLQATHVADLKARDTLLAQKDAAITQKSTDLANLQATRQSELQARDTLLAQRDALIGQKEAQLTQKATDLAELLNAHQAELKSRDTVLAQKDAALADAQKRLDAVQKGEVPQIGLDRLAQTTADSLKTTQTRLQQDRSGFQLGKVSLQLKVMTGNDGGQVGLPRTSDIEKLGANALGQVLLDFHPPGQNVAASSAAQTAVPPLAGYTELLARRKLGETGLRVEVLSQLVLSDDQVGRVVLQNPSPGTPVAPDSTVMIAIGKKG